MNRARTLLPLLLALGALPCPASKALAQREPQIATAIRGEMQRFVDSGDISGAVAVVGESRGTRGVVAVGRRDIEGDLPMEDDTLFRIASMTKPITALGVMMLADEGKLAVDDPVEKHLPEFRGQAMTGGTPRRPITLRDLLTHTSGLPDSPPPGTRAEPALTLEAAVRGFASRPLSFEPGSKWSYSNAGIGTLGRIIEVASGAGYEAFLKARIIDPLGMKDTTFYPSPGQMKRLAVAYDRKDGKLVPVASSRVAPDRAKGYPGPAGGLYSTAPDLIQLDRMLVNGGELDGRRYVSRAILAEMTKVQTGDLKCGFTDGMGFGLGFGVVREPSGVTAMLSPGTFGHGGLYGTQSWIDPARGPFANLTPVAPGGRAPGRFAILLIQRVGLDNGDRSPMRQAFQKLAFGDTY